MTDPETPNQPLLRAPTAVNAQGGRSSRAYKVAGITLLACILIVGQAMIAYFLLSQRNDIKSLREQSNDLKSELTKGRSVAVPVRVHMPMNTLTDVMDVAVDPEDSTGAPEESDPPQATDCQLEAAGVKPVQVPGFRPACDKRGFYKAQQCFVRHCWCVNPSTGLEIPRSLTQGKASCGASVSAGMTKLLSLPDVNA